MKIGVLGAGNVARDLHLPVLSNMPEVSVPWVCDKSEKRARQLSRLFKIPRAFTDLEQCNNVDIVLVAIPVGYRHEVMNQIFRRGWHAFCEKPFAVTLAEYDQYLSEASLKKVQTGVGMVRRYGSANMMARKIIHERHFGDIVEVWANEGMRTKRTGQEAGWYMSDPKVSGGGVLMETGSHLVDQLFTILNVLDFRLDKCIQRKFKAVELETCFTGTVSTDQQTDIRCAFEISRLDDLCNGIFIQFSNFILRCGLFFQDPLEMLTLDGKLITRLEVNSGAKTIEQAFFLEWQDFITQCTTGCPSIVNADTARQSIAVIEQCYKNAEII